MTQGEVTVYPRQGSGAYGPKWMGVLARNILTYILVFGVNLVVALPHFQEWVMCWIPKAVTASGTLSMTGAFFKGLIATGAFVVLQQLLLS